jgi:TPR repeat protein
LRSRMIGWFIFAGCASVTAAGPGAEGRVQINRDLQPAQNDGKCEDASGCQSACDQPSHPEDCRNLAELYKRGDGVQTDLARAAKLLRRACEQGYINACSQLGDVYYEGQGVARDLRIAVPLLAEGCDIGDSDECFLAAPHYEKGDVVNADPVIAAKGYSAGCFSKGSADACRHLMEMASTNEEAQSRVATIRKRCREPLPRGMHHTDAFKLACRIIDTRQ